jgi:hypothetical protein
MSGSKRTKAKRWQRFTHILGFVGIGLAVGLILYLLHLGGRI